MQHLPTLDGVATSAGTNLAPLCLAGAEVAAGVVVAVPTGAIPGAENVLRVDRGQKRVLDMFLAVALARHTVQGVEVSHLIVKTGTTVIVHVVAASLPTVWRHHQGSSYVY